VKTARLLVPLAVGLLALVIGGTVALVHSGGGQDAGGGRDAAAPLGLAASLTAADSACQTYVLTPVNRTNGTADERCLARELYRVIAPLDDTASVLPRIDKLVGRSSGLLAGMCHVVMHEVGRRYGADRKLTLATLQNYLPRSNDPGCSGGFAHGLITSLGSEVAAVGSQAAAVCERLETRYREYTCVHGLGHAYMRVYNESLLIALRSCEKLGARLAPDCGQGAFHDYWFSLSGADETHRPTNAVTSPRELCGAQRDLFVRACWYRVYLERDPGRPLADAADLDALCSGLAGLQRAGCITAGSVVMGGPDPYLHLKRCRPFSGPDVQACVRGVGAETLATRPLDAQVRLVDGCRGFARRAEREECATWLATALSVASDGRFARSGCSAVAPFARAACRAGVALVDQPLETFS
jgi:hypothetical protein